MKIHPFTHLAASVIVLHLCGGCVKDTLGPCTGNCQVVNFSGIAVDPGAQKPLANLTVTVTMPRRQRSLFSSDYEVVQGKTRSDGTFALTTKVDTTLVGFQFCLITVVGPANYIVYTTLTGPGIGPDGNARIREWPLPLDSTGTAPFEEYDFFQSASLTLQLHRTGAIVPP